MRFQNTVCGINETVGLSMVNIVLNKIENKKEVQCWMSLNVWMSVNVSCPDQNKVENLHKN